MGGDLSRNSLEIQISNNTKNITLKNPRALHREKSTVLRPQLPPGSSDSCRFPRKPNFQDFEGLLVYEAESFTLAIYVYIPKEQDPYPHVLQLELSLEKVHLGDLEETCFRISEGMELLDPSKNVKTRCERRNKIEGTVTLNAGRVRVIATVPHGSSNVVKVVLERWGVSGKDSEQAGWSCKLL